MLICDQAVSFDDFKVLASIISKFHLKIKEGLLISRDQPILNENEACLVEYFFHLLRKYVIRLYVFLLSSFRHCYLLFIVFSNNIYALVSFKVNPISAGVVRATIHAEEGGG